ncbi:MAG: sulfatase-like hydrolase/transferase [Gammaproteobacteria bacterium]|nr:sulfatase-like hydrolase/transferase [Gammaproteobacteria bacterium]
MSFAAESAGHRGWRARLAGLSTGGLHALAFVVVPNLPYALLMAEYALRSRAPLILLYWCVGVVAPKCPHGFVACAMAAVVSLDIIWLVSGLFFLHPSLVVEALRYAPLIHPAAYWLYLAVGAGAVAAIVVPAYVVRRHRGRLLRGWSLAAGLMGVLVAADLLATVKPGAEPPVFDSAMRRSAVEQSDALRGGGSLLVVMVENLGVLADPAHSERLLAVLDTEAVRARYRVRDGVSPWAGMTTGATSRELCGRWATWGDYLSLAGSVADCLPARLRARGYETHAVHAYTGRMFDRFDWYPKIGFAHLTFEEQMRARGEKGVCGTVFRSACDTAAADIVRELLTAPVDRPRFVYWLTVDSHMPIDPAEGTGRWDCRAGGPFGNETVCLIARIWAGVFDATARIATDPALPARTSVLLVGDHPPSFVSRAAQRHFVPGVVPWIALEPLNARAE